MRSLYQSIRSYCQSWGRIIWGSAIGFIENQDYLKASALTLYTLLSIVPVLAVAFGIAKGFGFEQFLESQIADMFDKQREVFGYFIQFSRSMLQNAKGGVIAGVGLITLFWANLSLLGSIENALNDIWKVKTPRTWSKKFSDYLAVMIFGPIFFVASSSLSVFLMTQITETAKEIHIFAYISPYMIFLIQLMPVLLSILLFIMIYLFIPNVEIRVRPRIIAGILAGIAFQLWQWIYIRFQVGISNYGAIYGTFAALPLFLIWLQVSWLIVLAGAEMAAHIENEMTFPRAKKDQFQLITPKQLALLIVLRCVEAFGLGKPPLTTLEIAKDLEIPFLDAQRMVEILEEGNILVEVYKKNSSQHAYQPSHDARLITFKSVCDVMDKRLGENIPVKRSETLDRLLTSLKNFDNAIAQSQANIPLSQFETL